MGSIPSKCVGERISFRVPFGDEIPFGLSISKVDVIVSVASGIDDFPQRVFWRAVNVDNRVVTLQFRKGLPGVIYNVLVEATTDGVLYSKKFYLAITPDSGNLPGLFPLTRIFTSHPYPQFVFDSVSVPLTLDSGTMADVVEHGAAKDDKLNTVFTVSDGKLLIFIPLKIVDAFQLTFSVENGKLRLPPNGKFKDASITTFTVSSGILKLGLIGNFFSETTNVFTVDTGSLYWEFQDSIIIAEDGKVILSEDSKVFYPT